MIISIGTSPNPLIKSTVKGLEVNSHGGIVVNEDGLTSREGIYAGGDAVTGRVHRHKRDGRGQDGGKGDRRIYKEQMTAHCRGNGNERNDNG